MEVESVFVTGANRGIGLEFVKQLIKLPKPPHFVFATYREKNSTLVLKEVRDSTTKSQVLLIKMDITKKDEIKNARTVVESKLQGRGLNLLINNAATLKRQSFFDITEDNMVSHFTTNAVGPVLVLKEMLPLFQKTSAHEISDMHVSRAAVLNISSTAGSIGESTDELPKEWLEMVLGYKTSKTALNMAMKVISLTVKDQGILIVNMCPGWVRTDMGSQEGKLTTQESISAMLRTLPQLSESHHGTFLDRNGKKIEF